MGSPASGVGDSTVTSAGMLADARPRFERAFYYSFVIPNGWRVRYIEPRHEDRSQTPEFEFHSFPERGGWIAIDEFGVFDAGRSASSETDVFGHIEHRAARQGAEITCRRSFDDYGSAIESTIRDDGAGHCWLQAHYAAPDGRYAALVALIEHELLDAHRATIEEVFASFKWEPTRDDLETR